MSLDLLVTRLKAAGVVRVYKLGEVPAVPASPYSVLSLDSGTPSTYTLDSSSDSMRRLSVQMFAKSQTTLTDQAERADAAFRDVYLTELPGEPKCNREMQTPVIRDPDGEGLLYLLHTYRYQHEEH